MFLAEGLGAQVDATHLESAGGGRPRRGVAKRRVRSRALQENPVVLFLRGHVFLLPPDDAVKAFDEPVPQVNAVKGRVSLWFFVTLQGIMIYYRTEIL